MPRLSTVINSLRRQPAYTLMRGAARFPSVRAIVAGTRSLLHGGRKQAFLERCEDRLPHSLFIGVDREDFVLRLRDNGLAHGLELPASLVAEIRAWAERTPCYADRDPEFGFVPSAHPKAEAKLGKPILLAQHFNTTFDCPAIAKLATDPLLQWIACRYLDSMPTFVGANLWWTFPVRALEADRDRHAHLFHRDVDDFRFFKIFFYLTDVRRGEGAHVCVSASHREPPRLRFADRWNIRRYSDDEIAATYSENRINEICGGAGTGFAENTLCIHKGRTPQREARLLLQLQYALFDYGAMHDRRDPSMLRTIV